MRSKNRNCLNLAWLLAVTIAVLYLTATGCSSQNQQAPGPETGGFTLDLPAPATLGKQASSTNSMYCKPGADYDSQVVSAGTARELLQGVFSPDYVPAADPPALDMAFALYKMSTHHRPAMSNVTLSWEEPAGIDDDVWVGLSDYPNNRWQWFPCTATGEIDTGMLDNYVNTDYELYVAVVCTGTAVRHLNWISLGERDGRWVVEQMKASGRFLGEPSLRVGSENQLVVAYSLTGSYDLMYGEKMGDLWIIRPLFSADAEECALDLGPDDTYYISYYDRDTQDMMYVEGNLAAVTGDALHSVGDTGSFNCVAVDQTGHPHFAWRCSTNESVNYTWFDGEDWHPSVVTLVGDVGGNICMAVNSFGLPRMAYNDWDSGQMVYSWHTGLAWQHNSPDTNDYPGEDGISIALDSAENTHLVYYTNHCDPSELRHNVFDGTDWTIEVLATEPNSFYSCAMTIDSSDTIHVAYTASSDDSSLRYMSNDGGGWELDPELILPTTQDLAIGVRDGVPYILCCQFVDDDYAPFIAYPLE